jgi:amino acid transporter
VLLVSSVIALLSLINIASSAALNAILSLTTLALYVSYLIPISLLVLKRLRKETIDFGPWHLGNFGLAVNIYALVFGIFIIIFLPFPASVAQPLTTESMNYAGPVFLCVLLLALGDWMIRGRKHYVGPAMDYRGTGSSLWSASKPEIVTVVVRPKLFNV